MCSNPLGGRLLSDRQLREVGREYVETVWPFARDWILAALERGDGEWDEGSLLGALVSGDLRLLVAVENVVRGVLVCQLCDGPLEREAHVLYAAGAAFTCDAAWIEARLSEWAKANGAGVLQAYGRPALVRVLAKSGWQEKYRVVRKRI